MSGRNSHINILTYQYRYVKCRGAHRGDFGASRSTVVFLNNNLSVLEVTLVFRRKLAYYYAEVYWRSHSSLLSGKIAGSQTRVTYRIKIIPFQKLWHIAELQIKPKSKSNQTKNLERLYNCLVSCFLSCSSRWEQFWCYSGLWRCWLIINDWHHDTPSWYHGVRVVYHGVREGHGVREVYHGVRNVYHGVNH